MQLFAVRVTETKELLSNEGVVCLYTRGEAIKKARAFNGKIEKYGKNFTVKNVNVIQLSRKEINLWILNEMNLNPAYKHTDSKINEDMYAGHIFQDILDTLNTNGSDLTYPTFIAIVEELKVLANISWLADYVTLVDEITFN